jgi:thiol-disulfide isomerase/thioredoxin
MHFLGSLALSLALCGSLSTDAGPTDPARWVGATGQIVADAIFQPINGVARPLAKPGRITVLVAFASWCKPCLEELPLILADYRRFGDRVEFLGIDYADTPEAGNALIARFHIPFPVERYQPDSGPKRAHHGAGVKLPTITPKKLPTTLPMLSKLLPPEAVANLEDVAAHCKKMKDADCVAYARAHDVLLADPSNRDAANIGTKQGTAASSASPGLDLPHLFILDGEGKIVFEARGFEAGADPIPAKLDRLGVR